MASATAAPRKVLENKYANEAVMEAAWDTLQAKPETSASEIYDRVKHLDTAVGDMDVRQFHARVLMPIKREMKETETPSASKKTPSEGKKKMPTTKKKAAPKSAATTAAPPAPLLELPLAETSQPVLPDVNALDQALFDFSTAVRENTNGSLVEFLAFNAEQITTTRNRILALCR